MDSGDAESIPWPSSSSSYMMGADGKFACSSFSLDDDGVYKSKTVQSDQSLASMVLKVSKYLHSLQYPVSYMTNTLVDFWYNDLPPLYGPLRMTFYGCYWLITFGAKWFLFHSRPTRETFYQEQCENRLANGILHFGRLGFEYKREGGIFNYFFLDPGNEILLMLNPFWTCSTLTWVFWSGLVFSFMGLGGKLPRFMVAISFWLLFGIRNAQFMGESSHSHYLAGMAMTALCFAENNLLDAWSLDYWVHRRNYSVQGQPQPHRQVTWPQFTTNTNQGPSAGGAARKFVLFIAVCSIFFAGMHKLSTWGFRWMDGETLYVCLDEEHYHWKFAHDIFYNHRFLVTLLAIATIIGEIGAFAVLLYPWWRPYGIASFYAFHIGVFALMQPNFISNEITYLLIVDWRQLGSMLGWKRKILRSLTYVKATSGNGSLPPYHQSLKMSTNQDHTKYPFSWRHGAWAYTIISLVVFVTSVCRIDAFPFFSWSLYNWHPSEPGNQMPFTQELAQDAAHRCLTKPPFNPACQNHGTTRVSKFLVARNPVACNKMLNFVLLAP
jgi:hypothetical protein